MNMCRTWVFKLVFEMKHLQYIKFLGTVLGSSQSTREKISILAEFITWGYVYWGDIKWTCKQAKRKEVFSDNVYHKETWFDKRTSKGVQHLNRDLNDKKEPTMQKTHNIWFQAEGIASRKGCKVEMRWMCSRNGKEATVVWVC